MEAPIAAPDAIEVCCSSGSGRSISNMPHPPGGARHSRSGGQAQLGRWWGAGRPAGALFRLSETRFTTRASGPRLNDGARPRPSPSSRGGHARSAPARRARAAGCGRGWNRSAARPAGWRPRHQHSQSRSMPTASGSSRSPAARSSSALAMSRASGIVAMRRLRESELLPYPMMADEGRAGKTRGGQDGSRIWSPGSTLRVAQKSAPQRWGRLAVHG